MLVQTEIAVTTNTLGELVELLVCIMQSMVIAPPEPPRSAHPGSGLRSARMDD
jgi:hypothetical protein